jgi:nucleotide-binding universal stress UspA family protein
MPWFPVKNVVVPLDFSDFSFSTLEKAVEFVENLSDIHVVHVLPELSPMEPGVIWGTVDDASRTLHVKEELRKRLKGSMYDAIQIEVLFGQPSAEIARYAEKIGSELIIVHSQGKGGTHLLLGSTAERVTRLAKCPVLVLKD